MLSAERMTAGTIYWIKQREGGVSALRGAGYELRVAGYGLQGCELRGTGCEERDFAILDLDELVEEGL